jgi:DNA polymerase-3 subunit epsilon
LCRRFENDASARTGHGALLEAQILSQGYLAQPGGPSTLFSNDGSSNEQDQKNQKIIRVNTDIGKIKVVQANEQELEAHNTYFSQG